MKHQRMNVSFAIGGDSGVSSPQLRKRFMGKRITQYAHYGMIVLVNHIKDNEHSDSIDSMTYGEFCTKINNLDKDNKSVPNNARDILENIGHSLSEFDSKSPRITILLDSDKDGVPSDGFRRFFKKFDELSDSEKNEKIKEEKKLLKEYLRAGKLDKFLSETVPAHYFTAVPIQEDGNFEVAEGATLETHRKVEYRSRDCNIVTNKKKKSGYVCECCGFDFRKTYGELGKNYIECHHIKPLADYSKKGEKSKLKDLAALCANCHRMIHRLLIRNKKEYKDNYHSSMDDLRDMMKK